MGWVVAGLFFTLVTLDLLSHPLSCPSSSCCPSAGAEVFYCFSGCGFMPWTGGERQNWRGGKTMNFSGSLRCSGGSRRSTAAPQQLNRRKIHQNFQYCLFFFFFWLLNLRTWSRRLGKCLGKTPVGIKVPPAKGSKSWDKSPQKGSKSVSAASSIPELNRNESFHSWVLLQRRKKKEQGRKCPVFYAKNDV